MTALIKKGIANIEELNNELFNNSCNIIENYFKEIFVDTNKIPKSYDDWITLILNLTKDNYVTKNTEVDKGICTSVGHSYFSITVNFTVSINVSNSSMVDNNDDYTIMILFINEYDSIKDDYTALINKGWVEDMRNYKAE